MQALRRRSRRGVNAVEFGLVLPTFCVVFFGIIEFGWYFFQHASVMDATRDACREASTYTKTDTTPAATVAYDGIVQNLKDNGIDCSFGGSYYGACWITADYEGAPPSESVMCDVTVSYRPWFGFIPVFPESHHAESHVLLEQQ